MLILYIDTADKMTDILHKILKTLELHCILELRRVPRSITSHVRRINTYTMEKYNTLISVRRLFGTIPTKSQ